MSFITKSFLIAVFILFPLALFGEAPTKAGPTKAVPTSEGPPTVIDSDHLEMVTLEEETRFIFSDNVKVTATNMTVQCDRLEVYAGRHEAAGNDPENELGRIQRIFAIGNVRIEQEDRIATSGRAEVFPQEGRIVLMEDPVVRNEQGTVSGHRIILYQGESRAVVESGERGPARITLPTMPDLGSSIEKRTQGNEQSID